MLQVRDFTNCFRGCLSDAGTLLILDLHVFSCSKRARVYMHFACGNKKCHSQVMKSPLLLRACMFLAATLSFIFRLISTYTNFLRVVVRFLRFG
jgi:hypothetical protein